MANRRAQSGVGPMAVRPHNFPTQSTSEFLDYIKKHYHVDKERKIAEVVELPYGRIGYLNPLPYEISPLAFEE